MSVKFSVNAEKAIAGLDRLEKGPGAGSFESALAAGQAAVSAKVHRITGALKGSGHPESTWEGESWTGTIAFAQYPGIYELHRGNAPTANHPEGGHYFFDPGGQEFAEDVKKALLHYVTGGEAAD